MKLVKLLVKSGDAGVVIGLIIGLNSIVIVSAETVDNHVFPVIGLDGFVSRKHFFREAVQLTQFGRTGAEQRTDTLGFIGSEGYRNGHGDHKYQHKNGADAQHHDQ